MIYLSTSAISAVAAVFSNIWFQVNQYRLPLNFFIIWLPYEGVSLNWLINYVYQILVSLTTSIFFFIYFPISLILINHSCYLLDSTVLQVADLNEQLNDELVNDHDSKEVSTSNLMTSIIVCCQKCLEYRNKAQSLIALNLFVEFSLMSFVFCLCIYTMTLLDHVEIFSPTAITMTLTQLYIYCLMGTRIIIRSENLAAALYDTKWYLMSIRDQKKLCLMIQMAQNMKTFDGVFRPLSMATFQKVCYVIASQTC